MAIRDLLWACPVCGAEASLRPARRGREACQRCGATFRRGRGSEIEVCTAEGSCETRPAAAWLDALPSVEAATRGAGDVVRSADVRLRRRTGQEPIRPTGEYLNVIDRFGEPEAGRLELTRDALRFRSGRGTESWPIEEIAALGSSSKDLQLRIRKGPVLAVRFVAASVRFWEELLRHAVRERYRAAGRGEVVEFQPRIVTR